MSEIIPLSYTDSFRKGLRPDPELTVSEWADRHRQLTTVASGEPGKWRTERTPYLREIMDCLSPSSPVERVVMMKGAQLGGTEAGLNWLGFIIHQSPGPMLLVQPTVDTAKKNSKQRIDPLIESCDVLREIVKDPRSRDSGNTILMKEYPGGVLVMTGANSAVGLRSTPVRFLFLDEVDGYPGDVEGEGDPVELAIQRTATFAKRKILIVSTPTIKDFSRIEAAYEESDKRQYWVPCPFCHQEQVLVWRQVKWPDVHPKDAYFECIHCLEKIQDYQKGWMLPRGRWIAQSPGADKPAGFHISSLYSPHGWLSWGEIATLHVQACRDPARLKTWVNTKLGETWEESFEQINGERLMDRREDFGKYLPENIAILTAGIDVHPDRLETEVVGWGRDEESWSIDYKIFWGDPSGPNIWQALDEYLKRPYPHSRAMKDLTIFAAAIDSGGANTLKVYEFVRSRQDRRIWAIKGMGGAGKPLWPRRSSRNNKGRIPLFIIGVDTAKEAIYARLKSNTPGPGYCHFPSDRDMDYFQQLTAEKVSTKYQKGRAIREWVKANNTRNEALDCRVYAMAALHGLITMGYDLNRNVEKMQSILLKVPDPTKLVTTLPARKIAQRRVITSPWM